ncbi:MAG: penicillin-binding protein 2 [Candidatus Cloacimonetes bacterium]|nr:penicillin-binding protein 2 [Candidatus Cloacimonadota bacterium]MCF7814254.1 penicillin-binding protein 2 [Candidatus Cloacimonadota bacterium]MCF7868461.1 penicillin-binding protein 2 [Candidatus Cloacimonadota bacterium]MCF7883919.1 penicillin-binding protein 2 [Candidatus Cloacimonadota bacterium]
MYKASSIRVVRYIILFLFLVLFASLFRLQVIEGKKYESIAENNIVRIKKLLPVRGEIFDQKFRSIALNKPSINLYCTPGKVADKLKLIEFISQNFSIKSEEIEKILYENRFRLYQEILLVQNVDHSNLVRVMEFFNYYPSLSYKTESIRDYSYPNHFSGHLGRINEKEYKVRKEQGYTINSFLGKTGLEKQYESLLRGKNGHRIIQVDASGNDLQLFKHNLDKPAQNGADLILTIDNQLQAYSNSIFPEDMKGAIVVMNAETGGILTYLSKPEFDQNIFSSNISTTVWNELMNDQDKPMLDRIIHGAYPPGSVYKPIMATLGLETNTIQKDTKLVACDGGLMVGDRYFKCWWEEGHGRLDVIDAMKVSCDVFFYDLSLKFSLDDINQFSKKNMITRKTGVDLPSERSGFFPTHKWYIDNYGKYVPIIGHKVNLAIGQGEVLTTTLQICAYYAALSNNGKWMRPHLLKKYILGNKTSNFKTEGVQIPVSEENLELLRLSLWKAVNERYGTGTAANVGGVDVYGKTGSAENHMGEETHSWFAGFVETDEYKISFIVFVENGGHGGSVAAPIAGKIIQFYDALRKQK